MAWAEIERPHDTADFDLLGIEPIVARLSALLTGSTSKEPAIAVLGPYGCGKSTLLRRLEERLKVAENPKIVIVRVSAWGFDESASAAAHILETIVDQLQPFVDMLPFRGLPKTYRRLLSAEKLRFLEKLLDHEAQHSLQERLEQLSQVLRAIDVRVVLFIEDADRRQGAGFDPTQLERLLWHFRQTRALTYVLAIDPATLHFDLGKLCEREEPVPELSDTQIHQILHILRTHCTTDFEYLLPPGAKDEDRLRLGTPQDSLDISLQNHFGDGPMSAVRRLVNTPRLLKQVVRRVDSAWTRLRGEVDLDDLIALTVLRVAAPTVFNAVRSSIRVARLAGNEFDSRPEQAKNEWTRLVETVPEARLAQPLIDSLGIRQLSRKTSTGLQSVQSDDSTDYFDRIVAEDVNAIVLDQEVLRDMHAFLRDQSDDLPRKMSDASNQADHPYLVICRKFVQVLPADELWRLTEQLLNIAISATPPRLRDNAQMACWAATVARPRDEVVTAQKLYPILVRALKRSIPLAADLYNFWAASGEYPTINHMGRLALRNAIHLESTIIFADPTRLVSALEYAHGVDQHHWLAELLRPSDQGQPPSSHRQLSDWQELARPFIDALRLRPSVVGPQLARVLGRSQSRQVGKEVEGYTLEDAWVVQLFGDLREETLNVLASLEHVTDDPVLTEAARQARGLLQGTQNNFDSN